MIGPSFEVFLAKLYTDQQALRHFLADPRAAAENAGLTAAEITAMLAVDPASLRLAASSFGHKRAHSPAPRRRPWWRRALHGLTNNQ